MTTYQRIRCGIENALKQGKGNFIIYPFGENGLLTKQILNQSFGITEECIIDNILADYNPAIKKLDYLKSLDCSERTVLLTSENPDSYDMVRNQLKQYCKSENIVDIFRGG